MEQSLFIDWVKKYFPKLAIQIGKETLEGEKAPRYYHQEMLRKKYSLDGTWEAITGEHTNIAADIVSMDSRLSVKSRDSIRTASGEISKVGMKLYLTEKQLKNLDTLVASNADNKEILSELFRDLPRVIKGVYERNELSYLTALSTGVLLSDKEEDASIGVRIDFNYYDSHKSGVSVDWANPATSTPIQDIDNVIAKADEDNRTLNYMILKTKLINQLRKSQEVIKEIAIWNEQVVLDNVKLPSVSKKTLLEYFKDEKGLTIEEMKRKVTVEKKGTRTVIDPWPDNAVIFLDDWTTGDLVWSKVAEMNHKKKDVEYQTVDDYILVSKYHHNDPIREITASQGLVTPILTEIGGIYLLESDKIEA